MATRRATMEWAFWEKRVLLLLDLKRREVGVLVLVLELVFLVISISMAYICLSVCLSSTWDTVEERKPEIKEQDIDISFIDLSRLFTFCLLISYSVIHPFFSYFFFFFPFLLYHPQRPTRLLPRVFSLALGRELAHTFLTTHGLVPYLPAIKLSMYLAGNAKYYKLKQKTRSEELRSTMRCFFIIIIIIRAFWVIDGKERKREREGGLQIGKLSSLFDSRDYRILAVSCRYIWYT